MIPAGADPIAAADVARILGISLGTLRNTKATSRPGFPAPLNASRGRDLIWDRADIEAYATGRAARPRPEPSPEDLLDDAEAAAVIGVSVATFVQQLERIGAVPQRIEAHRLRYWRRGDLVARHQKPPGRPGKPQGAVDLAPRRARRGPSPVAASAELRRQELADHLADLSRTGALRPSTRELAERFDVSAQTVRRWLARIGEDVSR